MTDNINSDISATSTTAKWKGRNKDLAPWFIPFADALEKHPTYGHFLKGYLFKMRGRAIPAANVAASSLSELWRSEILVSYSSFYWNLQERVGSEELPLDLTRAESDESE